MTTQTQMMEAIATSLDEVLNGKAKGNDRTVGFVLLTYQMGELGKDRLNQVNYVGNGDRKDVHAALKELLARWDGQLIEHGGVQ